MPTKFTYCYASILVFIDLFDRSYLSSDANPFYSTNEDVRYLVDRIPVSFHQEIPGGQDINLHTILEDHTLYSYRAQLKFSPPFLDFKQRNFGVPNHATVTVINTSCNKSVHLSSISGNSIHFHSSFFQNKAIPPLTNTTFDVVFLGRGEGEIKSVLLIHTSEGNLEYHVKGQSSYSPYRLRSLSGVNLPFNASYAPLIVLHNPHSTSIQLSEVFSSSDEFHLELPLGGLESPKQTWSVPAFLTKPIIRLRFQASSHKNHTAYIRLTVDQTGEIIIIPINIEVSPFGGLYAPDDLIDFGIGGTGDNPKVFKLFLRNSGRKAIKIQDVYSMPYTKSIKIDFQNVKVTPDSNEPTEVAVITFDWKSAHEFDEMFGQIVIVSTNSHEKLVLTYVSTVLEGGIHYDINQTKFQSDQYEIEPRVIVMTNRYKVPVTIFNVSIASEAAYYFQVVNFEPFIFQPGEVRNVMVLEAIGGSLPLHLKLESEILVYSNVSTLSIPVLCYDGKLSKVLFSDPSDTELYFGTVGSMRTKVLHFALVNENPVAVQVLDLSLNMSESTIYAVAVEKGNTSTASIAISANEYNDTLSEPFIGPGYFCVIQVSVPAGPEPGNVYGEVKVETEYEVMRMPLFMRVEHGDLRVVTNPVEFNDCFPSAICTAEVRVESNFSLGMAVTSLSSIPFQPRLGFIPASPPLIPPLTTTLLGHVTWDMSGLESYLTLSSHSIGGHTWLDTLSIPNHIREWDVSLLNARYEQYSNVSMELLEFSLRLDTTEVKNIGFKAIIRPIWPSVLSLSTKNLSFPLTQVGKVSYQQLTIINPASKQSIILQLIFDTYYPLAKGIVDDLPTSLRPPVNSSLDVSLSGLRNSFQFVFEDDTKSIAEPDLEKNSVVMYLKPFSNITVTIAFMPERAGCSSSILLIRNNLTILELVHIHGSGAHASFKFGNRKPKSLNPLLFKFSDKHLKDCRRDRTVKYNDGPNVTITRSFYARNYGALPLTITGFYINGYQCQGFGFKVLDCQPFLLLANSSKKVEIAFTPDFTLSRIERELTIHTSALIANYSLMATLPPSLLATCASALSRPYWEPMLYYMSVTFMGFLFVCVLSAAIFESNRILRNTIVALSREQNVQPLLDLSAIGGEVTNETHNTDRRHSENQPKLSWNQFPTLDCNIKKMVRRRHNSASSERSISNTFNNKPCISNGVIQKRKPERVLAKRYNDFEQVFEKTSWNTMFSRSNINQAVRSMKTPNSTCFTTEPYSPLANLKARESPSKSNSSTVEPLKCNSPKAIDIGFRKPKKRAVGSKKAYERGSLNGHVFGEIDTSSSTAESSNDDGDKEVESMFFKTVRHHLQTKTGKTSPMKYRDSLTYKSKMNKPIDTPPSSDLVAEDDVPSDKTTIVAASRSCKRPNSSSNKLLRQSGSSGKLRLDPLLVKGKFAPLERNLKSNSRKDRGYSAKKSRIDKSEKSIVTRGSLENAALSLPPPPPPPVWTASFSDIVARSEFSYSSIVALKNAQQGSSTKLTTATVSISSVAGKTGNKPLNIWNKWNGHIDPPQCQSQENSSHQGNSLFAHTPQQISESDYENLWNDAGEEICHTRVVNAIDEPPSTEIEMHTPINNYGDMNWPIIPTPWEPLYTPATSLENIPPVWGSDVWAPPPRHIPNAQNENVQHTMEYDPFRSLSNIWAQHSTNIWKPPTTE